MFDDLTFQYPYFLLLIVVFIVCAKFCKIRVETFYMPHLAMYDTTILKSNFMINILKWITIVLSIVALSSPIKQSEIINNKNDGIDIILCLDTSGSMRQIGFNKYQIEQNRWDIVREIVKDFIIKRATDNLGLIVFGNSVMIASPLTYDKKAQIDIIDNLDIGIVGDKTALLDGIATSINILSKRQSKSKIVIVLTDGEDTASTIPYKVVEKMAQKYNVKIYTIGIGESNSPLLNHISKSTKAVSYVANSKDNLQAIYTNIDTLEKSKIGQNKIILKEYYFFYPLFLAFLSLVFLVKIYLAI
jgi:Ca-activated chloride channel family protein